MGADTAFPVNVTIWNGRIRLGRDEMNSDPTPPETKSDAPAAAPSSERVADSFISVARNRPPIWGWLFAAACLVIPVLTVIDVGLPSHALAGVVSAVICVFASFNRLPLFIRVILCIGTCGTAWSIYVSYRVELLFEAVSQIY